ncbi:META domain-containing protein [Sphingomonas sp. MMS12-HWE2-04]|uniref:META domain-containing protein n=1 Tax=Sphingomonas sp. MMS12-HWE2-04 TaxID=3234199 RepID=UPI00385091FE
MRASLIALAATLTLAGMPAQAQSDAQPYRAAGNEPFWTLTIGARTMQFEAPGRQPVRVATPRVIHGFAGEMWQTRRVDVNSVHQRCNDGMRGEAYADTVTVKVDGRVYKGCGGEPVASPAPASLLEGSWTIQSIGGRPPLRGTHPSVEFRGDRISGDSGCNRFSGSYRFVRGRLTTGPLASTRRACVGGGANAQEQRLLRLIGQRLSVSSNRGGKLVVTAANGQTLVLARR